MDPGPATDQVFLIPFGAGLRFDIGRQRADQGASTWVHTVPAFLRLRDEPSEQVRAAVETARARIGIRDRDCHHATTQATDALLGVAQ